MSQSQLNSDFQEVVAAVFDNWTALQLAIANGPGGLKSQEIVSNMISSVTQSICSNENIDSYDVADMLHDMLDENFQTVCEDDSPEEVGEVLLKYFSKCCAGEKHLVDLELGNVKKLSASASQRNPSRRVNIEEPATSEVNGEGSGNDVDANGSVNEEEMEVDDGWTTVKSKRRT
ncbi:pre-rRNA-processing protein TSR2 homolog [Ischnura elegans]|uniref:pre-rRNA-processing protein TSR2 homolog n=1 Tax=Ischnura elegans TaxID=197161 RepID=UPI001ED89268|nr:pre-rRNA-processing protein TSR2 homolog [Ischnura elegans]